MFSLNHQTSIKNSNFGSCCSAFKQVLYVPPPDLEARHEILGVHTRKMKIGDDVDLRQIAEDTELFTGAELEGLCKEAGIVALREDISATVVCNRHFEAVMTSLRPGLSREDIECYASFLKNPSVRASTPSECGYKLQKRGAKSLLLAAAAPVAIAVVSLVSYTGMKSFSVYSQSASREPTPT